MRHDLPARKKAARDAGDVREADTEGGESAWWDDRFADDWVPHTREQNQAILDRLGLTGPFWELA
jgi:hypothetical protein